MCCPCFKKSAPPPPGVKTPLISPNASDSKASSEVSFNFPYTPFSPSFVAANTTTFSNNKELSTANESDIKSSDKITKPLIISDLNEGDRIKVIHFKKLIETHGEPIQKLFERILENRSDQPFTPNSEYDKQLLLKCKLIYEKKDHFFYISLIPIQIMAKYSHLVLIK